MDGANVEIFDLNLKIADEMTQTFNKICNLKDFSFSESIYSKIIWPELSPYKNSAEIRKIFGSEKEFKEFLNEVERSTNSFFEDIDWPGYEFAGFSLDFGQISSSLYLIKMIKKNFPNIDIIVGGPNATGKLGKSLLENFREIDMAISGEGELNFYNILKSKLMKNENYKDLLGIIYRENGKVKWNKGFNQINHLDELETPRLLRLL